MQEPFITTSLTDWTPSEYNPAYSFRLYLDKGFIFRKETSPAYYGGYRILKVGLKTRLAAEWINDNFDTMGLDTEL